jgi:hypothetical protein
MEQELLLPNPPYEKRQVITRGDIAYEVVKGRAADGISYCWVEKVELVRSIFKAKFMPTRGYNEFKEGKLQMVHTYWAWHYYNATTDTLEWVDKEEACHETVYADLIYLCQQMADPIMDTMLNGLIIGPIMGFPTQPLVVAGEWVEDQAAGYDTSLPADKESYRLKQPLYVAQPVTEAPGTEESI